MIRNWCTTLFLVAVVGLSLQAGSGFAQGIPGNPNSRPDVEVNTQKSLEKIVGAGFPDAAWISPEGLLPTEFSSLKRVSGPDDTGTAPKAAWRKPLVYQQDSTKAEVHLNCYRRLKEAPAAPAAGTAETPYAVLMEPDYQYQPFKLPAFPQHKAALAREKDRVVLVVLDGDLLFKIEIFGGGDDSRSKLVRSTAETIFAFRRK